MRMKKIAASLGGVASLSCFAISTALAADVDLELKPGWNLIGNPFAAPLPVVGVLGTQESPKAGLTDKILTAWQWDAASGSWMFHTPLKSDADLKAYVKEKSYTQLTQIAPGSGMWVNVSATAPVALRISGNFLPRTVDDMPKSWSLNVLPVATRVDDFNRSSKINPPASSTEIPDSVISLWAWDAVTSKWLFYAPSKHREGLAALANYSAEKGYLDFMAGTGVSLDNKMGFWVNRPELDRSKPQNVFPVSLAIASPIAVGKNAPTKKGADTTTTTTEPPSSYEEAASQVASLIASASGTVQQSAQAFISLLQGMVNNNGNASCYGPTLNYTGHPDNTGLAVLGKGTLPSGDLGIWLATDGNGVACASAQLDARLLGTSARANGSLGILAALLGTAYKKNGALPGVGATVDVTTELNTFLSSLGTTQVTVTVAGATVGQSTAGTWVYALDASIASVSAPSASAQLTIDMTHTLGTTLTQGNGLLRYAVSMPSVSASCGTSTKSTVFGSVKYAQSGSATMLTTLREGNFCGASTVATAPSGTWDATTSQLSPSSTWSDNFTRFGANFNPLTRGGSYLFGWQAGVADGNARVFAMTVDGAAKTGDAWYGFGDDIKTTNGDVKGFMCNWAGPGNTKTVLTQYAQRQKVAYNSTSYKWEPSASSIRYAPVNTCLYDGSKSFWYDRNLDTIVNEASADQIVAGSESDFIYKSAGAVTADIAATGFTSPGF